MITIRPGQTLKILEDMPEELFQDARKVFERGVSETQEEVKDNLNSKLTVRSGQLRRSLKTFVRGNSINTLRAGLYFTSDYAPIQEFGGTVKAKNAYKRLPGGPYLNIPTKFNQHPSGVQKKTAKSVFGQGGFIRKTGRGYTVFLQDRPMFSLVKSVDIPARMGFLETAQKQYKEIIKELEKLI
jgi:hypothetical protein